MVLHSRDGPGVAGSAGSQAGQARGPSPRCAYCYAEVPGARDVQQDRAPAVERTPDMKTGELETNWLTPMFSSVQRTRCKPGKNPDHLMGRTTSSAQKLLFQVAY